MGCIDETGILNEDECFIQCDEKNDEFQNNSLNQSGNKYIIINSKIAVGKNPCMHPGDIRILNAVDRPKLRHLVNCIVFPAKGYRPITSMCSGSDLDGDLYWVTWDLNLIPNETVEPMNYDAPAAAEEPTPINIDKIINFFVDFIKMDQLGRLANAHQALADKDSVNSEVCKKIALAFSYAVDFPKTGHSDDIPDEMKKPIEYPDFMQKPRSTSYKSNKIIGKMFRKCKKIYQKEENYTSNQIEINQSFIIDGHENYLDEAKQLYVRYRNEIERVMSYFGCDSESELFIGVCVSGAQNDEARDKKKVSSMSIRKIWKFFRDEFFEQFENILDLPDIAYQQASAWYVACYSDNKINNKIRILSFPWIIEDVFQKFPNIYQFDHFSNSILNNYLEFNERKNVFIEIIKLKEKVSEIIKEKLIIAGLFGLFISENLNDFHFYIVSEKPINNISSILANLEHEFENVTSEINDGVPKMPIKCQLDNPESFFTISFIKNDIERFLYLRQIMFENDILLPLFYSILHFARIDSLDIKFETYLEFFVTYCIKKKFIKKIQNIIKSESDEIDEWFRIYESLQFMPEKKFKMPSTIGQIILNFYRDYAFDSNSTIFDNEEIVSNTQFKNHCFKVFNSLSNSMNISSIWDSIELIEEKIPKKHSANFIDKQCKYFLLISNIFLKKNQRKF